MRVLVTGAAGGIGQAIAELFSERHPGAAIALVDRDADGLAATAERVASRAARPLSLAADLSAVDAPGDAVRAAIREFGGLDVLVSNAGVSVGAPLKDLSLEVYERTFAVNTRAAWLLAQAAYPALVAAQGAIVVTASISGHHPTLGTGVYSASKAAVIMLVKQLALEWGPDGVRVNCVSPGPVETPMTFGSFGDPDDPVARDRRRYREQLAPLRRIATPHDIAEAVLFLSGSGARHVTGTEIVVDGGTELTTMPGSHPSA